MEQEITGAESHNKPPIAVGEGWKWNVWIRREGEAVSSRSDASTTWSRIYILAEGSLDVGGDLKKDGEAVVG